MDSSPSTSTDRKCSASNWLVSRLSWVTVIMLRRMDADAGVIAIALRESVFDCKPLIPAHYFFVCFPVVVGLYSAERLIQIQALSW